MAKLTSEVAKSIKIIIVAAYARAIKLILKLLAGIVFIRSASTTGARGTFIAQNVQKLGSITSSLYALSVIAIFSSYRLSITRN
jgi:carbamoylphosphate synthase large subunit